METRNFMDLSEDNVKQEETVKAKEVAELDLSDTPANPKKEEKKTEPKTGASQTASASAVTSAATAKATATDNAAATAAQAHRVPIVAEVPDAQKKTPVMVYVMAGILVVLIIVAVVLALPLFG